MASRFHELSPSSPSTNDDHEKVEQPQITVVDNDQENFLEDDDPTGV